MHWWNSRNFSRQTRAVSSLLMAIGTTGVLGTACSADMETIDEAAVELDTADQDLYRIHPTWPNGVIPVCWSAQAVGLPDFPKKSQYVRRLVLESWSSVANVDFTGWEPCTAQTKGKVVVSMNPQAGTVSSRGYEGSNVTHVINLGNEPYEGIVPRQFGLIMGFVTEIVRPGFQDDASGTCAGANIVIGNKLNTAPDRDSITNYGHCHTKTTLSRWDVVGAQSAYGHRTSVTRPLIAAYNAATGDHVTVSNPDDIEDISNDSAYAWAYTVGWVFQQKLPNTVPLRMFWSNSRKDYFLTATDAGIASAVNYENAATQGYVFKDYQPGTVPLFQYWHPGREDNMLVTAGPAVDAAIAAGYQYVREEGFVPQDTPYRIAWQYWSSGRSDYVVTGRTSLADNAINAGYTFFYADGAYWRHNFTGTVPLANYWSEARHEHFTLATQRSRDVATAFGYVPPHESEGFVYEATQPGHKAIKSFYHPGREDHFTTMNQSIFATNEGYGVVREEGWGIQTNL